MDADQVVLARRFATMDDATLLDQLGRDALNEVEQPYAVNELATRGLRLPASASSAPAAADGDNPYRAPAAALTLPPVRVAAGARFRRLFWWGYIGLLVLVVLRMSYVVLLRPSLPLSFLLFGAGLALTTTGLIGWRLRRPLGWRGAWGLFAAFCWFAIALAALGVLMAPLVALGQTEPRLTTSLILTAAALVALLLPACWGSVPMRSANPISG